ncbi:MBL fold metallo-hydrolase [Radicibacter daui]|uniref:MBL fold metallo-hydrolase n=1 Tax=Radicibacter daui TaxID=3064829 RepID=UPI004046BF34
MKITILGCGTASGVPMIDGDWGSCDPAEPRNRRLRASILVEYQGYRILVDTSPDLRQQLLTHGIDRIDAVLYTHEHADHTHGIDELRVFNWRSGKPIDIWLTQPLLEDFRDRFAYIFRNKDAAPHAVPAFATHIITPHTPFTVCGLKIMPFKQDHGRGPSLGFRFGDFAYSTDVKLMPARAMELIKGVDVWVVDCLREAPHPTHSHLAQTLGWIGELKPRLSYLTHMSHHMDYRTLMDRLPAGIEPAYDGLVIEQPDP